MFKITFLLSLSILMSHFALGQTSQAIPVEHFSRLPQFENVVLSPDGKHIAFVQNFVKTGDSVLRVFNIKSNKAENLLRQDQDKVKVNWFRWVNNRSILISVIFASQRAFTETSETRLLVFDIDDVKAGGRPLFDPKRTESSYGFVVQKQDNLIDILPEESDYIMVALDSDVHLEPSVFKVNIYNQKQKRIERGKHKIRDWFTDRQSHLRIGYAVDYETGDITYYERKNKRAKWRTIFNYNSITHPEEEIIYAGFDGDPNVLFYKKYHHDKLALFKVNLSTDKHELVYSDPDYDVDGSLIYSRKKEQVIGVRHSNSSTGRIYFDKSYETFQTSLSKVLPDTHNYISSLSYDENVYVLFSENDSIPGAFYIGNRKEGKLAPLLFNYPELENTSLVDHKLVTYNARDGLEIEGYLSIPKEAKLPLPTIIFPHGGPGARDYSGFDYWTAFFANHGYVVFRPNFRGSKGFGFQFAQSQIKSWGLQMQDDITDGTNWLISEKIADENKLCIVGASYGGYAALMATVKTPDLFQCSISFAGVSDLNRLVADNKRYANSLFVENQIGDDKEDLKSRSAAYHVGKIKTPILLVHGEDDRVVDLNQSKKMALELERKSKPFKFVVLKNGDHYLSIQENRHQLFREMAAFLTQFLD